MKNTFTKIKNWLSNSVMPAVDTFTKSRYLQIIMDAFMGISALTIAGSLFTLILSLPLGDWYVNFLTDTGLKDILNLPVNVTTNLISLYLVFSIGYATAKSFGENPLSVALISLGSFLLLTPTSTIATITDASGASMTGIVSNVYSISYFGATGMFGAMIIGLLAARIYILLSQKGLKIRMPSSVPQNVAGMFEAIIPGGIVFIIMVIINLLVGLTPYDSLHALIYGIIQVPFMSIGGGTMGAIVFVILSTWLWMFGIHGGMVAYSTFSAIYQTALLENMTAFAAGTTAPYPLWSLNAWYAIGGTGCTLALVILMIWKGKSSQSKMLGKLGLPCAIFNINEPIIFGCPIIMNPYLAIPFCIIPLLNYGLTVLVMSIGLVAWPTGAMINGFMPVVIFGSLVNGSWTGAAWTIVLIILSLVIWYPFFKKYDENAYKEEIENTNLENA